MSLKDKFAGLRFEKPVVETKTTIPISEEWSRLIDLVKPMYPEVHVFFKWLAEQGGLLKQDDSGINIAVDGECFARLPAVTIDVNEKKRYPDGSVLM